MISGLFKTKRANVCDQARRYLQGLTSQALRKNMERMDEHLPAKEQDYEGMQHFLSNSPWKADGVFEFIAGHANRRLGGRPESMLIIDESGNSKKGESSVGVARQYNGRLGKQDNCQVGVYAVLNCGAHSAFIDADLFLPDSWVEDPERCRKAGVPEERISKQTKIELARGQIQRAEERGVEFACVGLDAFYGRDQGLLAWIGGQGRIYCADIPANALVFPDHPGSERPARMSKAATPANKAAAVLCREEPAHHINLREGENGILRAEVRARRVWTWEKDAPAPSECWLIVRRIGADEMKISRCNAPANTALAQLAAWQAGRYYVERAIEDGKSHAGMASYQARGWLAWHHHMALVALALLFIMEERLLLGPTAPLISARDVVELLDWYIHGARTRKEVIEAFKRRQAKRERNALNAQKRDRKRMGLPKIKKLRISFLPK